MIQIFKLSYSCFEIEKLIIGYYLEFVFCYLKFLIIYPDQIIQELSRIN